MNIYSIEKNKAARLPIKSSFIRGVPRVSVIGLSEGQSQNYFLKLKAAMLSQGFKWSVRRHLILSLGEAELSLKHNKALDLAVVASALCSNKLINLPFSRKIIFLGELDIFGNVKELSVSEEGFSPREDELWIGNFVGEVLPHNKIQINKLKDLNHLGKLYNKKGCHKNDSLKGYDEDFFSLEKDWRELAEILIHGEHHCLFLTSNKHKIQKFSEAVISNLRRLKGERREGVRLNIKGTRPLVKLNSSITKSKVLGNRKEKGLSEYAKGGVLLVDNYFLIERGVRELLSLGLETGEKPPWEFKLESMIVARSALCPCGKAELGQVRKCGFSLYRCRSTIEKISSEELSMFQIIKAPKLIRKKFSFDSLSEHSRAEFDNRRKRAALLEKNRQQKVPNSQLELDILYEQISEQGRNLMYLPRNISSDKTKGILSVARSIADLEGSEMIEALHVDKALDYSYKCSKEIIKMF